MKLKFLLLIMVLFLFTNFLIANDSTETFTYTFKNIYRIKNTPVKDQGSSGTCWAYATISFLESEVLRETGKEVDLAEMYIVRGSYAKKARKYVRLHGANTFAQGGQSHDVIDMMNEHGIVPEQEYPGLKIDGEVNHKEISKVTKGFLDAVLDSRYLTNRWYKAFNGILDVYLGEMPTKFNYQGQEYTPKNFLENYCAINTEDYIELTSYTNYPFYQTCCLEVPDNWSYNCNYYNVPIDDLEQAVDHALKKGYSICWDADVSEAYFSPDTLDIAILPTDAYEDTIEKKWDGKIKDFVEEKEVDQALRQETFDNFHTTDDHLMHLVGLVEDQQGNLFYKIKNSWGTEDKQYEGYYYISKPYFRMKTIALMINKNALPGSLKTKLKLNTLGKMIH